MTQQLPPPQVETIVEPSRPSRWPWVLLIAVLVLVLACGLMAVLAIGGFNQAVSLVQSVLEGGKIEVRTESMPSIITQVQELGRLETASYTVEKVIEGGVSQPNQVLELLLGDRLLLVAHGEVVAGVDLTEMSPDDITVSEDGTIVSLRLPPARILTYRLDNEQSYVYDRDQGLLSKGDPNLETEVRRAAEREILQAACGGGILQQATENAQRQLTILLTSMGFERVSFAIGSAAEGEGTGTGCQ